MAFNFFIRKKASPEQVEPPKNNLIDADLLLVQIELMQQTYFSVAKTRAGKGEPRGYCSALNPEFPEFITREGQPLTPHIIPSASS